TSCPSGAAVLGRSSPSALSPPRAQRGTPDALAPARSSAMRAISHAPASTLRPKLNTHSSRSAALRMRKAAARPCAGAPAANLSRGAASEPGDDAVPIVVEGHGHGHRDGREEHHLKIFASLRVGALRRQNPGTWHATERGDQRKDPERHGTDPKEVADQVFRQARGEVDDEAEDGALGLDDEPQLVPGLLADQGAHIVGAEPAAPGDQLTPLVMADEYC